MVEAGLQPWEALAAATWRGGELLGEAEAGVIREGGPATSSWCTVIFSPIPPPSGVYGGWPDRTHSCHAVAGIGQILKDR